MRHAKSSWDNSNVSDHDRPLLPIGIKKTQRMIGFLQQRHFMPDLIMSSSASRAKETALLIAKGLDIPSDEIVVTKDLYHAWSEGILDILYGVSNSVNHLMIFGHNPTFTDLANYYVKPELDNLPTSALVSIQFDTDKWEEISMCKSKVDFVIFPKMLK